MIMGDDDFTLTQEQTALELLKNGNGYLTAKTAGENGVKPITLKRMEERGLVERVARGLYTAADIIPDPFFVAQYRCPQGVFSHETALFFHDFSDRTPFQMMMTIPSGFNTRLITNNDMMIFYSKPKQAKLGAVKAITPYGLTVIVYDIERTLCDCLRNIDKLDKDLVLTALKRYMKDPASDKAKLLEYAAAFKIRDIVLRYMEVLS
jgi:predicted transcriptional regulator of viral defense system